MDKEISPWYVCGICPLLMSLRVQIKPSEVKVNLDQCILGGQKSHSSQSPNDAILTYVIPTHTVSHQFEILL